MTFRARIDNGVMGLLLAFPIASSFFNVVLDNSELFEIIMSVLIECLIVSLIISALLSVKYTLEENELVISRLGIKSTLAYVNISEIVERLGMLSFEAPSVSQVRLTKKDGTAIRISPVDVKGFISEIKKRIR
ncbi:MAG: PH domain-containing protein [Lachnospiraceae bacterium]|nr:PH domain-containing protein [Lachnospiraceae bacterium]